MQNKSGGMGCGMLILIVIIMLVIIGSMSGGDSKKSSGSYSSSYTDQQFRDDYNYIRGRYDAMTGQ